MQRKQNVLILFYMILPGVRDYIHIMDLAEGHLAALTRLLDPASPAGFRAVNLGAGVGHSVLEVIHAFEQASGRPVPYTLAARRPGDVAASYADCQRAKAELGWQATRSLLDMCKYCCMYIKFLLFSKTCR